MTPIPFADVGALVDADEERERRREGALGGAPLSSCCTIYDTREVRGGRVDPQPRLDQRRPVVRRGRGELSPSWGVPPRRRGSRP